MKRKITYEVQADGGYVRVFHSRRGLIAAAIWSNGRVSDIHIEDQYRKNNMIRMPAMSALAHWESKQTAEVSL